MRFRTSERCVLCNFEGNRRSCLEECVFLAVRFCWVVIFFTLGPVDGKQTCLVLYTFEALVSLSCVLFKIIYEPLHWFYGLLNTDLCIVCSVFIWHFSVAPCFFPLWYRALLCILDRLSHEGLELEDPPASPTPECTTLLGFERSLLCYYLARC